MKLTALLAALPSHEVRGDADPDITGIEFDSRAVGGGALFVCLEGLARNGHDFAAAAVSRGACALVVRTPVPEAESVPQIVVPDTREALARLAAAWYGRPSGGLTVIGVTGTNGKTTVTHLLRAIGEAAGRRAAVFGTLGNWLGAERQATKFTTPEAPTVQRLFREARDAGVDWVAMEVSSHALAQKRVFGTDFAAVVFTNLTRDHLDYHGDLESYFAAKALLFSREGRGSDADPVAVINGDDPAGARLLAAATGRRVSYGGGEGAGYTADDLEFLPEGTPFTLITPRGKARVRLRLAGSFNVLNAVAAAAAALELGVDLDAVVRGLESVDRIPGRMDRVPGSERFAVLVDYAHTPDGLQRALTAARGFTRGRLFVVFGCGGDRDRGKRPEMGRVASRFADVVVLTSDNPRSEDPAAIIHAVQEGMDGPAGVIREPDRARAVEAAIRAAREGDTVLIAGKGHETVQITRDGERPFDDREVAGEILKRIG